MDMLEAHFWWVIIGLCLILAELMTGTVLLLALALAAFLTAVVAYMDIGLTGQLVTLAISGAVLVPIGIKVIRPHLSPAGIQYGSLTSSPTEIKRFSGGFPPQSASAL